MGCTQSKQRTDAPAAPAAAAPSPVKIQEPVAVASVQQEAAPTPKAEAPTPMAESPVEAADVALATPEVAEEQTVSVTIEPETTVAAEMVAETPAVVTAEEPAPSAPVEVVSAPSTPVVPALQMPSMLKKSKKATTPRKTTTPRKHQTPQKENVTTKRSTSKTPAKRGLGLANANTNTAAASRKVSFESAPAPVANKTAARNAKVRKTLGKNASNVQMDLYAASVAAFERQLTYRGTLDKQLNTR